MVGDIRRILCRRVPWFKQEYSIELGIHDDNSQEKRNHESLRASRRCLWCATSYLVGAFLKWKRARAGDTTPSMLIQKPVQLQPASPR